jgi:exosortase/archaeosortase family protein
MQSPLYGQVHLHLAIIMDGNGRWATRRGLPAPPGTRPASVPCVAYPMRVVSATFTAALLQAHGLAVVRQGTFLAWRDELIQFDAPCSGVNMLWAGLLLTLMGCVLFRLGVLKVAAAIALALALVIAGNVLRASSLFYVEAGLVPHAPGWWHDGIGIVAFGLSAIAILWVLTRLDRTEAIR